MRTVSMLLVLAFAPGLALGASRVTEETVELSGVEGGLVVHLGCGDGQATVALRVNERYIVHGLDADTPDVEIARKLMARDNQNGAISVYRYEAGRLPYAENVINLLIVSPSESVPAKEINRTLAPLGCAMLTKTRAGRHVADGLKELGFATSEESDWIVCKKPWPDSVDEWSHWLHGPDGNPVAKDSEVGPPRRQRWRAGPRWERSHEFNPSHTTMVTAGGRIFYTQDDGLRGITDERFEPRWSLRGRDAFSGVPLWTRELPNWSYRDWQARSLRTLPMTLTRRMVASGDRLYMTMGYRAAVSELDAATGATLRVFEETELADELVLSDGALYVVIPDLDTVPPGRLAKFKYTAVAASNALVKVDLESGETAWRKVLGAVTPMTLAVSGSRLVVSEGNDLVCLTTKNGAEQWRVKEAGKPPIGSGDPRIKLPTQLGDFGATIIGDGVVLVSGAETVARSLESGDELWRAEQPSGHFGGKASDLFLINGAVWGGGRGAAMAVDLKTGKPLADVSLAPTKSLGHHSRCFRAKATSNYILTPNRGSEFVNVSGGESARNDWVRGACRYGVMPANGLLYVPPHPCMCYHQVKLNSFNALAGGDVSYENQRFERRLFKGPAYKTKPHLAKPDADDWPMHRRNPERLGSSATELPSKLSPAWSVSFSGPGSETKLSQPVVVDERVFIAEIDRHRVVCLDANDGAKQWTFNAGGRIDSAPTVVGERVYFGSADGWVYCLVASDGKLVWRFRAAPEERFILSYDQVESVWPVHGSVVVLDGPRSRQRSVGDSGGVAVYCTAGRSSYLDGGVFVYALDARTGELKHHRNIRTVQPLVDLEHPTDLNDGFHIEGAKSDILVSDGRDLYIGQVRLDRELNVKDVPYVDHTDDTTEDMDLQDAPYLSEDPFAKLTHDEFRSKGVLREFHQGDRSFGLHLHTTTTFLDDSMYNRTFWSYSKTWPGYYLNHIAAKSGQLIAVDADTTYGFHAYPLRQGHNGYLIPGEGRGFAVVADANDNEPVLDHRTLGRDKGMGFTRDAPPLWHTWIKVRARAMTRAGQYLALAGTVDDMDVVDPFALYAGEAEGRLLMLDARTGETVSEMSLPSAPRFDGMSAADESLFVSLMDGSLVRLSGE